MNEMPPDSIQMANPGCQTTLGWDPGPRTPAATAQLHAPHRETRRDRRKTCRPKETMPQFSEIDLQTSPWKVGQDDSDVALRGGGTGRPPGWAGRCQQVPWRKGGKPHVEPSSVLKGPPSPANLRHNPSSPQVRDTPELWD